MDYNKTFGQLIQVKRTGDGELPFIGWMLRVAQQFWKQKAWLVYNITFGQLFQVPQVLFASFRDIAMQIITFKRASSSTLTSYVRPFWNIILRAPATVSSMLFSRVGGGGLYSGADLANMPKRELVLLSHYLCVQGGL